MRTPIRKESRLKESKSNTTLVSNTSIDSTTQNILDKNSMASFRESIDSIGEEILNYFKKQDFILEYHNAYSKQSVNQVSVNPYGILPCFEYIIKLKKKHIGAHKLLRVGLVVGDDSLPYLLFGKTFKKHSDDEAYQHVIEDITAIGIKDNVSVYNNRNDFDNKFIE